MSVIAVLGAGAWGSAIACVSSGCADSVVVLTRSDAKVFSINNGDFNPFCLPGFKFPCNVSATCSPSLLLDADLIFVALPAQSVRSVFKSIVSFVKTDAKIIICSKGIEKDTLLLISDVIAQIVNNKVFFLSGPNFAKEVASGVYSFANIAGQYQDASLIARQISTKNFFVSAVDNLKSAQVIAALKNVMAIFCGIVDGLGFGFNTNAAALTLALEEISRFSDAITGDSSNINNFCGVGDIVLTCCNSESRNMRLGKKIATNSTEKDDVLTEGLYTLDSAIEIVKKHKIKAPITDLLGRIVYKKEHPKKAMQDFFAKMF